MNKDDRILVGAIVTIIAMVFLGSSGITGSVIKESSQTSIIVSPKAVSIGEVMYVTVVPGNDGVNVKTSFYQAEDDLRKSSVSKLCNNYRCDKEASFSYVIPSIWESGVYYIKVYDYDSKEFVVEDFTVI